MDNLAKNKGFTLVEVLIVVGIIGILAAIAIPNFGNQRDKAHRAVAIAEVRDIQVIVDIFWEQHGRAPEMDELEEIYCGMADHCLSGKYDVHDLVNSDPNAGHGNDICPPDPENPGKKKPGTGPPVSPVCGQGRWLIFSEHDIPGASYIWALDDDPPVVEQTGDPLLIDKFRDGGEAD